MTAYPSGRYAAAMQYRSVSEMSQNDLLVNQFNGDFGF